MSSNFGVSRKFVSAWYKTVFAANTADEGLPVSQTLTEMV